jgi:glucosamine 6-phosphate synthetase-like amidotransferase/phosphosugar isomerase protein
MVNALAEQQGHSTFMRSEILAQPAALAATIDALLPRIAEVAALASRSRQVLFFARGTSDNAAVYGSYLIQTAGAGLCDRGRVGAGGGEQPGAGRAFVA